MKYALPGFALALTLFTCCSTKKGVENKAVGISGSPGTIDHYEMMESSFIRARNVDVWLPEQYGQTDSLAVLYMHDGQNLFNPESSYAGISWEVDVTLDKLIAEELIAPCLVVGIWNTPDRTMEYTPMAPYKLLTDTDKELFSSNKRLKDSPRSNSYLKFIVYELKPFIDSVYKTKVGKQNTFIAGSSMGGLISLYALTEYPHVFGGAACLSTHWPLGIKEDHPGFTNAYIDYLSARDTVFNHHKLYFDHGTIALDEWYEPHQKLVDSFFGNLSLSGHQYQSMKFNGAAHNEHAWQSRFHYVAEFLVGKE